MMQRTICNSAAPGHADSAIYRLRPGPFQDNGLLPRLSDWASDLLTHEETINDYAKTNQFQKILSNTFIMNTIHLHSSGNNRPQQGGSGLLTSLFRQVAFWFISVCRLVQRLFGISQTAVESRNQMVSTYTARITTLIAG
jgi:hypothetical protein